MARYILLLILSLFFGLFPRRFVCSAWYIAGYGYSYLARHKFAVAQNHMRHVLGRQSSQDRVRKKARQVIAFNFYYWGEFLWLLRHQKSIKRIVEAFDVVGLEYMKEAEEHHKGIIGISVHVGPSELGVAWYSFVRNIRLLIITERDENRWFAKLNMRFRESLGVDVLELNRTMLIALKDYLEHKGMIGLVLDRSVNGKGREFEFFGEKAKLPLGGALALAKQSGAPILPVIVIWGKDRCVIHIDKPLYLEKCPDGARILSRTLEAMVSRVPEQWHVVEPVWPLHKA